jgi:uncharacterized membrane-anchored protein YjiN (DUF445 family)
MRCQETLARSLGKGPDQIQPGRRPLLLDMSASAPNSQRRSLVRNRLIASGLLGIMAALFVATALVPQPAFWVLLVRATAEAALVGGLADWFAVTAIFRQPLGLPIPHTAIVPKNKDRIGEGLATFIAHNFLTADLVRAKLRSLDPARRLAEWLALPTNAQTVAFRLIRVTPYVLAAVDDRDVRQFVGEAIGRRLNEIELAPLLERAVAVLTAGGLHESLIDRALELCRRFVEQREDQFYAAAEAQRRRWWIPKAVNRQIAKAMVGGVEELLANLQEPGSPARKSLLKAIEDLVRELGTSPEYRARIEQAKTRLLEDAEVTAWFACAWQDTKAALLADLASPGSKVAHRIAAAVGSVGQHLLGDATVRARLNRTLEAVATEVVPWRNGLAQFICEVVRQWDAARFAERIEAVVGGDLQYIRITGTLVGGLVGCVLHLAFTALQ